MNIGAFIPTTNRPDFARFSVLQLAHQSIPPTHVTVYQNGNEESYQSIISDLTLPFIINWIHTNESPKQNFWYAVPLKDLIDKNCDYYFWIDHDDIYHQNHIETSLNDLKNHDFRVSKFSNMLFVDHKKYKLNLEVPFSSHGPGGMSSSVAFNKNFAKELYGDLINNVESPFADNVLVLKTMPKFKCFLSEKPSSTTYVSHRGSFTSAGWVDEILYPKTSN